jgi:hypothetical protein
MALSPCASPPVLDEAIKYCSLGWRVLPVKGKQPQIKNWPSAASNNPFDARRWFRRECNIGVATGQQSGIVVLDIDPRNGGDSTLQQLERELGSLPPTVKALSGGGGVHLFFQWFDAAKSTSIAGIDFQADGKMIVVAPSMHPITGALYEWECSPFDKAPAALPKTWRDRFCGAVGHEDGFSQPVEQGRRNDYLASVAGRLRNAGEPAPAIRNKLLEHNATDCLPPLTLDEVEAIAASIARYGAGGKSIKTQWQEMMLDSSLPAMTKLVLMALSMYSDQHGKSCWPTQEQIALKASCSDRCVRDHLDAAERSAWIKRYQRPRRGKTGFSYGYILLLRPEPYSGSRG